MNLFFRRHQQSVEVPQGPSLAAIAEQEAFERVAKVREAFSGLLTLFPDGPDNRVFDDPVLGRRAWLHHVNEGELGGGIFAAGAKTFFGWTRQSEHTETLTVLSGQDDHVLYELHPELRKLRVVAGNNQASIQSELGQRGIERLERVAETFGDLALRSA